jgi:hypothetical protein
MKQFGVTSADDGGGKRRAGMAKFASRFASELLNTSAYEAGRRDLLLRENAQFSTPNATKPNYMIPASAVM